MHSWSRAARDALVSGTVAAAASTVVLAACGVAQAGSASAPVNAISHWRFGASAARQQRASWRYTATGVVTHHVASVVWATLYEKLAGQRRAHNGAVRNLCDAAALSAFACAVDHEVTPSRLTPGFERRLDRRALAAVYTAFAAGLALGGALLEIAAERRR